MSEPEDTSKQTFESGFYDGDVWNEQAPYPYSFHSWINGLDKAGLKKWWPKKWAEKFGGMEVGHIYTYNAVKGRASIGFKPGDRVKLIHTRPELMMHVEVQNLEKSRLFVGLVHVVCLMLDGGMDNKGM